MTFAYDKLVISLVHNKFETSKTIPYKHIPIPAFDDFEIKHPGIIYM